MAFPSTVAQKNARGTVHIVPIDGCSFAHLSASWLNLPEYYYAVNQGQIFHCDAYWYCNASYHPVNYSHQSFVPQDSEESSTLTEEQSNQIRHQLEYYFTLDNLMVHKKLRKELMANNSWAGPRGMVHCDVVRNFPMLMNIMGGKAVSREHLIQALSTSNKIRVIRREFLQPLPCVTQQLILMTSGANSDSSILESKKVYVTPCKGDGTTVSTLAESLSSRDREGSKDSNALPPMGTETIIPRKIHFDDAASPRRGCMKGFNLMQNIGEFPALSRSAGDSCLKIVFHDKFVPRDNNYAKAVCAVLVPSKRLDHVETVQKGVSPSKQPVTAAFPRKICQVSDNGMAVRRSPPKGYAVRPSWADIVKSG